MKKAELEKVLMDTQGNVTLAAKRLGVERKTVYNAMKRWDVSEVLKQARDKRLDMAESLLDKQMMEGNVTAIIFFLKTQGKSRGYVERQEFDMSGEVKLPKFTWNDAPKTDAD